MATTTTLSLDYQLFLSTLRSRNMVTTSRIGFDASAGYLNQTFTLTASGGAAPNKVFSIANVSFLGIIAAGPFTLTLTKNLVDLVVTAKYAYFQGFDSANSLTGWTIANPSTTETLNCRVIYGVST